MRILCLAKFLPLATAVVLLAANGTAGAATLDEVRANGVLHCGVSTGSAGFAFTDDDGSWTGFDPAICQAVAAAVFADPGRVEYTPTTGKTRFEALKSGEIDLLARVTTWTYSRDVDLKLSFAGINYYDGQGFMVPRALAVDSARQLNGASVCIQTGTTSELNLSDWFRVHDMDYEPVPIETNSEARRAYQAGRCDVYTTDASGLAATRATFADPSAHVILPEVISKEPLGPLVRHGDDEWADVVRWVLNALILAEEHGITRDNVVELAAGTDKPEINRLLGASGDYGAMLGLDRDWAVNVIRATGNYAEIFNRFIGPDTDIGLERGLNALWRDGGILYAPPFR